MKKYFEQPELKVVRTNNNDIVTTSIGVGSTQVTDANAIQTPGRRRSIWD